VRLTARGRYAVTAMLDLAIYGSPGPTTLGDIARRQGISLPYLEQLFNRLRQSALVDSVRGPGGGYRLTRAADAICVAEVIAAVDVELDMTQCRGGRPCHAVQGCLTHDLWTELGHRIYNYLHDISLQDLMVQHRAQGHPPNLALAQSAAVACNTRHLSG
jgi:Rrf2 family transcriptional regulator, iron-sulfur cluster assembly transcription factor